MKRFFSASIMWLACTGMVLPQPISAAPISDATRPMPAEAPAMAMVTDVALAEGGLFVGQVVDPQGLPVAGLAVQIRQSDRDVASVTTDANGQFRAAGLHGGVYQVTAGNASGVYRLWAPNTAPPLAGRGALLVSGTEIVRGQGGVDPWLLVWGLATAAVIAVPLTQHSGS